MNDQIYLAFSGHVSRTICAFTDANELMAFIQSMTPTQYDALPTVNPLLMPILLFQTSDAALVHFGVTRA